MAPTESFNFVSLWGNLFTDEWRGQVALFTFHFSAVLINVSVYFKFK